MRYFLFWLLFISTVPVINGQGVTPLSKKFILDFYGKRSDSSTVMIYTNGVNPRDTKEIIESIQKSDTLKNWGMINNSAWGNKPLVLTKEEKEFIIRAIESQADTSLWAGIAIPNAKKISLNEVDEIFKDRTKGWEYFYSKVGSSYRSFTIPIFFRNNTLCAFYYSNGCGWLCGEGVFAIYGKEGDRWVSWFIVYNWVS